VPAVDGFLEPRESGIDVVGLIGLASTGDEVVLDDVVGGVGAGEHEDGAVGIVGEGVVVPTDWTPSAAPFGDAIIFAVGVDDVVSESEVGGLLVGKEGGAIGDCVGGNDDVGGIAVDRDAVAVNTDYFFDGVAVEEAIGGRVEVDSGAIDAVDEVIGDLCASGTVYQHPTRDEGVMDGVVGDYGVGAALDVDDWTGIEGFEEIQVVGGDGDVVGYPIGISDSGELTGIAVFVGRLIIAACFEAGDFNVMREPLKGAAASGNGYLVGVWVTISDWPQVDTVLRGANGPFSLGIDELRVVYQGIIAVSVGVGGCGIGKSDGI